jgi:hypothetical protein
MMPPTPPRGSGSVRLTQMDDAPTPETAVPAADPGEVGKALEMSKPGDDLAVAAQQGSISAGEGGSATDTETDTPAESLGGANVVIGEIPDARDPTLMRWTARCSVADHGLLGHYDSQAAAQQAKVRHLESQHSSDRS